MLQVSNNSHRKEEEDVSFRSIIIQRRGCRTSCFNDPVHGSCITNEYVCILYSNKRILLFYFILFQLIRCRSYNCHQKKSFKNFATDRYESVPAFTCLYVLLHDKSELNFEAICVAGQFLPTKLVHPPYKPSRIFV